MDPVNLTPLTPVTPEQAKAVTTIQANAESIYEKWNASTNPMVVNLYNVDEDPNFPCVERPKNLAGGAAGVTMGPNGVPVDANGNPVGGAGAATGAATVDANGNLVDANGNPILDANGNPTKGVDANGNLLVDGGAPIGGAVDANGNPIAAGGAGATGAGAGGVPAAGATATRGTAGNTVMTPGVGGAAGATGIAGAGVGAAGAAGVAAGAVAEPQVQVSFTPGRATNVMNIETIRHNPENIAHLHYNPLYPHIKGHQVFLGNTVGKWQPTPKDPNHPVHKVLGELLYPSVHDDAGTHQRRANMLKVPSSVVDLGHNGDQRNVFKRYAVS